MNSLNATITAVGGYVPEYVLTNKILESSDISFSFYQYLDQEISTNYEVIDLIDIIDVYKPNLRLKRRVRDNNGYGIICEMSQYWNP